MKWIIFAIIFVKALYAQDLETRKKLNEINLLIDLHIRNNKIKNQAKQPMDCDRVFDSYRASFETHRTTKNYLVAGELNLFTDRAHGQKYFAITKEQLENMGKRFLGGHEILKVLPKRKVDGMEIRYLEKVKTAHSPVGSYMRTDCIEHTRKNFNISTQLVEKMDKFCREVKFQNKKNSDQIYYLTMCAGDKKVYLSYDKDNNIGFSEDNKICEK